MCSRHTRAYEWCVEETAVEETEETEEPEELEVVSGYNQIDKSLWQCTHCRETFPAEFSCWQHIVSKEDCHSDPRVLYAVEKYLLEPRSKKKRTN